MYQKKILGLEEARAAVDAVIAEASKKPDQPIAVAVVDDHGGLICFAKMDKSRPLFIHMAMNKAYTAASWGRATLALEKMQREHGWELAIWGDSRYAMLQGGVCIKESAGQELPPDAGTVLGGIGVSGRLDEEDERLAFVGLRALNL